jgi:general secretion pathway protein K
MKRNNCGQAPKVFGIGKEVILLYPTGSVLIVVIWVITILSILAVSIGIVVSSQVFFVSHYRKQVLAYFIARAGIFQAVGVLDRDKKLSPYDALKEEWSNEPELFYNKQVGDGFFTVGYEYASGIQRPESGNKGSSSFYGVIDEERKININTASASHLQALFQEVCGVLPGQAKEIADSIIDWRDIDDNPREAGAENSYYKGLSPSYSCKNDKFDLLEELFLVKGVSVSIFYQVKPYLTIYGDGKVNINTASYPVLRGLSLASSLAEKIIRYRAGSDNLEGTEDDGVFTQISTIVNDLSKKEPLNQTEISSINNLIATNAISVSSNHFQVISEGYLADISESSAEAEPAYAPMDSGTGRHKYKISRKIICVIKRNGKIVYWKE